MTRTSTSSPAIRMLIAAMLLMPVAGLPLVYPERAAVAGQTGS